MKLHHTRSRSQRMQMDSFVSRYINEDGFSPTISHFETLKSIRETSEDSIEIGLANAITSSRLWTPPYCWKHHV